MTQPTPPQGPAMPDPDQTPNLEVPTTYADDPAPDVIAEPADDDTDDDGIEVPADTDDGTGPVDPNATEED